jgi:hypothetical protein
LYKAVFSQPNEIKRDIVLKHAMYIFVEETIAQDQHSNVK